MNINLYKNRRVAYLIWRVFLKNPRFRLFLTKLLVKDENVTVKLFSAPLTVNKIREIGYWSAYQKQFSNVVLRDELGSLMSLALIISAGDTFVDVGANVGLYSSVMSKLQRVLPDMKIYAFEPNPDTFERLEKTLTDKNVELFNVAISSQEGELECVSGPTSGVFGVYKSHFQIPTKVTFVPCKRLDDFNIQGDSLVLKIDVEGHELEVLQGAAGTLKSGRVKAVYIDAGFDEQLIPALLESYGFHLLNGRTMEDFELGADSLLAVDRSKWAHAVSGYTAANA